MSLLEKIASMELELAKAKSEVEDLQTKNRKSAAPRARKNLMNLKTLAQSLRVDVIGVSKAIPVVKRKVKEPVKKPVIVAPPVEVAPVPEPVEQPKPKRVRISKKK
jgi:hypothetical protein